MSEEIIAIQDLSFSYDKKTRVLENISLRISRGEFIGIFGPNGGGKTTFLQLLMGFLKPTRGSISLFGTEPKKARKRIGYVPQYARFDKEFPLTVLELVLMGMLSEETFWGRFTKETKKKAEEALEKVALLHKKDAAFGTLSGGQAQRALIARALVSQPDLLLLDEPTASVDPDAEQQIYELLLTLPSHMTILMVTHNLQGIVSKAKRLLCISREVTVYAPQDVCGHYALGLYHPPLRQK